MFDRVRRIMEGLIGDQPPTPQVSKTNYRKIEGSAHLQPSQNQASQPSAPFPKAAAPSGGWLADIDSAVSETAKAQEEEKRARAAAREQEEQRLRKKFEHEKQVNKAQQRDRLRTALKEVLGIVVTDDQITASEDSASANVDGFEFTTAQTYSSPLCLMTRCANRHCNENWIYEEFKSKEELARILHLSGYKPGDSPANLYSRRKCRTCEWREEQKRKDDMDYSGT